MTASAFPISAPPAEGALTDDLDGLLAVLPPRIQQALGEERRATLVEIVLDLGRIPEARFAGRVEALSNEPVASADLRYVLERVGRFGADNRAGIERTLHRISALRNRLGEVVGLTCRVGRSVFGTVDAVRDVIEAGASTLLLGRPGVGKTTLLREAARVLAVELGKRVIVVDTSNEIAGDGDIPHPGIGRARRMQVPSPERQHEVMIEAVENHMPEVIVIDEIGTSAEALAARTIAERGVQLIATAHGNTLENLLRNPTLSDLIGGIHAVTLSDGEARRRGTQKTVLERKAAPTFGVVIEIQDKDRLAVHHRVDEVVDEMLRGIPPRPELRIRTADGEVAIERPEPVQAPGEPRPWREPRPWGAATARRPRRATEGAPSAAAATAAADAGGGNRLLRVFPYAVSRGKLDRAIRDLRVPAVLVERLEDADVVLTTKGQERRQPRRLRDAELRGTRLELVRSNTVKQIERFLGDEFGVEPFPADQRLALEEAEDAIQQATLGGRPIELAPQDRYVRRIQHELVVEAGLKSVSEGQEPFRRVVVYPA